MIDIECSVEGRTRLAFKDDRIVLDGEVIAIDAALSEDFHNTIRSMVIASNSPQAVLATAMQKISTTLRGKDNESGVSFVELGTNKPIIELTKMAIYIRGKHNMSKKDFIAALRDFVRLSRS